MREKVKEIVTTISLKSTCIVKFSHYIEGINKTYPTSRTSSKSNDFELFDLIEVNTFLDEIFNF